MTVALIDPAIAAQLLAAAPVEQPEQPLTATATQEVPIDHDNHADALADILKRAKGVRETGEKLVDKYIDEVWQRTKLTKIEAARQGLVAKEHNTAAWAAVQNLRGEFKSAVRKDARGHAHVAPKIASATKARTPEIDALLLQHAADPAVQQLAHLLGL